MPETILILTLLSAILAAWAYARAHKLHLRLEAIHPGFNHLMRCRWRKRR